MKLPWDVHPERDNNWFAKETRNMSKENCPRARVQFNASVTR